MSKFWLFEVYGGVELNGLIYFGFGGVCCKPLGPEMTSNMFNNPFVRDAIHMGSCQN